MGGDEIAMSAYLWTCLPLGVVTSWVVGDAIVGAVREHRQRKAQVRADAAPMLARYRERGVRRDSDQ